MNKKEISSDEKKKRKKKLWNKLWAALDKYKSAVVFSYADIDFKSLERLRNAIDSLGGVVIIEKANWIKYGIRKKIELLSKTVNNKEITIKKLKHSCKVYYYYH